MFDTLTDGMMKGPEGTVLRFFYDSVKNEQATVTLGRAIYDTALMVDVITPGQKSSTPRFELERVFSDLSKEALSLKVPYKRSYKYAELAEQAEAFKKSEAAHDLGGTPLKAWPRIDRGLAATLIAANVFTVEALADLSDANLDIIGIGARELRAQAQAFLRLASGSADTSHLTAQISEKDAEITRMGGVIKEQGAAISAMQAELAKLKSGGEPSPPPSKPLADLV